MERVAAPPRHAGRPLDVRFLSGSRAVTIPPRTISWKERRIIADTEPIPAGAAPPAAVPVRLRRGDVVTLEVESAAFEGRSVAHHDGLVVFVDGAVPGDRVEATVFRTKKQFAEARAERIVRPSPQRVAPQCAHFGPCGGCRWQHLAYEAQCGWKRRHVIDAFERIGGLADPPVRETLPAASPWYYRNKMEFSFGEMRWLLPDELGSTSRETELFALGLHVPQRYDRILSIEDCRLQSEASNAILNATRAFFTTRGVPPFSTRSFEGDLRHLVIREGKHTGERMVFLVTSQRSPDLMRDYAALLRDPALGVSTFVQGITQRRSTVAIGEEEIVHFGDGVIRERLGACTYRISPTSFFQTNTLQAERLYARAAEAAALQPADRVWDLYCGTGTIALYLAPSVREVLGVELNPAAVEDALRNARENGVDNARFACADILDFVTARAGSGDTPDVIIVDPPRAGLHTGVVRALGASGVRRIVYVSCNPATSARDCALLAADGYRVEEITPVDMFPHTYHIECVIRMTRD